MAKKSAGLTRISHRLMVFETEEAVVYQIRDHHRHQEVQEVIPTDYAGVTITNQFQGKMVRRSTIAVITCI